MNRSYEQEVADVAAWASANNACIYAKARDEFDLFDAALLARSEGKSLVIVKDLS